MDKKTFLQNKLKESRKQAALVETTNREIKLKTPHTSSKIATNTTTTDNNQDTKPSSLSEKFKNRFLDKPSFKVRMPKHVRSVFYPICIVFTIIFALAIFVGVFFTVLLVFYRLYYFLGFWNYAPYYDTTTKISGSTVLNIGKNTQITLHASNW